MKIEVHQIAIEFGKRNHRWQSKVAPLLLYNVAFFAEKVSGCLNKRNHKWKRISIIIHCQREKKNFCNFIYRTCAVSFKLKFIARFANKFSGKKIHLKIEVLIQMCHQQQHNNVLMKKKPDDAADENQLS